eukprot:573839-Amphidinium_carterae.1
MACLAADATIVATTFESVENFQTNFASSSKRVQALREKGVRVFHGVDATNLAGACGKSRTPPTLTVACADPNLNLSYLHV